MPQLPESLTNNAVALVKGKNGLELYSFNGLLAGKTWQDITNNAYVYKNNNWSKIARPITAPAVLASTAVSIGSKVYVIGGYTVDANSQEKSASGVFLLDTNTQEWSLITQMPVPVDDTVALVYANRYIYLISGWHDTDNISGVQVYDTQNNIWFQATDYPAPAVFGHAGGIVGNQMFICDGVKVVVNEKSRDFVASPECLLGVIDKDDPKSINWTKIPHHSNAAYYRMAATGDAINKRIVFAGGSDNPYNYDGIGYDDNASSGSRLVFTFNLKTHQWQQFKNLLPENMDHRALLTDGLYYYIVGGMESNQKVSNKIITFKLPQ